MIPSGLARSLINRSEETVSDATWYGPLVWPGAIVMSPTDAVQSSTWRWAGRCRDGPGHCGRAVTVRFLTV